MKIVALFYILLVLCIATAALCLGITFLCVESGKTFEAVCFSAITLLVTVLCLFINRMRAYTKMDYLK